jgi:hypothetical protein
MRRVFACSRQFPGEPAGPGGGGVLGVPEKVHAAEVEFDDKEHTEAPERDGTVDMEEVGGQ